MSAAATDIHAEWERIGILADCVAACRRGEPVAGPLKARLMTVNESVAHERRSPVWSEFATRYGLAPVDQDILACVVAPTVEPHIGWRYQALQPGIGSPYPSAALLRELLLLDAADGARLLARLGRDAPLRRHNLIEAFAQRDSFEPVRPAEASIRHFLGVEDTSHAIPGANRETVEIGWDDLVLPGACLDAVRELVAYVVHREKVVDGWGASHSGGPVALFAGPSGTGKSHAAAVVANALPGFELYRVDLGILVSKYVGETEKNLNALFDAAHDRKVVLLFDEADSLFGKRADVRDARDRYANMEISHLLSRIERHSGPCILTSNLKQHVDPAFVRRFHVVVDFPLPGVSERERLWRQYLPREAPRCDSLDYAMIAEAASLTGGQIKNAAVRAAFLAADEDASIGYEQLARSIRRELAKEGKEIFGSTLGALAEHLPEAM